MVEIDIGWMPYEAEKRFNEAVQVFAEAVRSGKVSGYHSGVQLMRRAGQIVIEQQDVSSTPTDADSV